MANQHIGVSDIVFHLGEQKDFLERELMMVPSAWQMISHMESIWPRAEPPIEQITVILSSAALCSSSHSASTDSFTPST